MCQRHMTIPVSGRQFLTKLKDLLRGLTICVLVLLIFEGVARIGYTVVLNINESQEPEWYVYSSELGWEPKPNFKGSVYGRANREFDAEGFLSVDTPKKYNANKVKVLFLGDSNTFGVTVPTDFTFVQQLEILMPNISAINLGVPGYTSFQGYQILVKKGLKVNPNIIVISFNFNDRRYVLDSQDVDNALNFQKPYKYDQLVQATKFLKTSYLYRSIHILFRKLNITRDSFENKKVRLDKLPSRVEPRSYRENLVRMVELARSKNMDVIFVLLKDNPIQTHYLRKGIESFNNSQFKTAIEYLEITDSSQQWFSTLSRIYLAKIYSMQGRSHEAENILTAIPSRSLHGGSPIYLDTDYNQIMKDVATEYAVEVVDAGHVLDENPSDYVDFCHFNISGHRKIAHLLHDRLVTVLSKRSRHGNGNQHVQ